MSIAALGHEAQLAGLDRLADLVVGDRRVGRRGPACLERRPLGVPPGGVRGGGRRVVAVAVDDHVAPGVAGSSTGGVPWVWKDSMVFSPQACPLARSASVQVIGCQSGARTSRAPALHSSTAVAAGLVDVEEERLLDGVLVRAGLDEHAAVRGRCRRRAGCPRGCRWRTRCGAAARRCRSSRGCRRRRRLVGERRPAARRCCRRRARSARWPGRRACRAGSRALGSTSAAR